MVVKTKFFIVQEILAGVFAWSTRRRLSVQLTVLGERGRLRFQHGNDPEFLEAIQKLEEEHIIYEDPDKNGYWFIVSDDLGISLAGAKPDRHFILQAA